MAALRALTLAVVACAAPPERVARPPQHAQRFDATPAPANAAPAADDVHAQALCHRKTFDGCLSAAAAMTASDDPQTRSDGADLYRNLCSEGDRRGCFEDDTTAELQAACRADGFVTACRELGRLHTLGEASCAYDMSCAEELFEMACTAGDTEACNDAKLYAPHP